MENYGNGLEKRRLISMPSTTAAEMTSSTSLHEKLDHWKIRLFDEDESISLDAATGLVAIANASKELRAECTRLLAERLEMLHRYGGDLYLTLKAVSDLSKGITSSSEALMRAIMKTPVRDSYALNTATDILLYETSEGFISPAHHLEQQVLDMASEAVKKCKGNARRNALRLLELAETHSRPLLDAQEA
ncbi:hypothetical protein [Azohydromonas caseinilytica]|uniref:Uncharacterized protein n=1 Tax=Azohydromonas caseinilytica TaxID=2728836 RepID=A0A848FEW5_9BURK|nr:hypothetical protein [Azohydromonas caseinilytica]NML17958.1 hypothetical protein [Azohydromonas caseinilytica]